MDQRYLWIIYQSFIGLYWFTPHVREPRNISKTSYRICVLVKKLFQGTYCSVFFAECKAEVSINFVVLLHGVLTNVLPGLERQCRQCGTYSQEWSGNVDNVSHPPGNWAAMSTMSDILKGAMSTMWDIVTGMERQCRQCQTSSQEVSGNVNNVSHPPRNWAAMSAMLDNLTDVGHSDG